MQQERSSHALVEEHSPSASQLVGVLMQPLHPSDAPHPQLAKQTQEKHSFVNSTGKIHRHCRY